MFFGVLEGAGHRVVDVLLEPLVAVLHILDGDVVATIRRHTLAFDHVPVGAGPYGDGSGDPELVDAQIVGNVEVIDEPTGAGGRGCCGISATSSSL